MAYKSQVTNKYYGGTSAGTVASARSTELSAVIDVLKNDFNPAIGKLVDAKIDEKKDTAKSKVQELYASGKSVDVINQEILDGKHPDLSGDYVNKTVSYHTGRFKAGEVIAKIKENSDNYDFKTQTLDDFYKPFLPEFKNADGSFALGFGAVFNEWKANQAIADGEKRAEWKHNTKMEKGVSYLDTVTDIDENYWKAVSSLGTILPKDKDGKQTYYFDADEQNEVAIAHAKSILAKAETAEDIDKALKILGSDRGVGKGGNKLGSLVSTNKKEVLDLVRDLKDKRVTLIRNDRIETEYKETKQKQDLVTKLFEPNEDGSEKTYKQKQDILDEAKKFGDVTYYNSVKNIVNGDISQVNNDPDQISDFMTGILEGKYQNFTDMVKLFDKEKFPPDQLSKAVTYWNTWKSNYDKGIQPIWQTNETYKGSMGYILDAVAEPFKDKIGNIMKGGEQAQYNARKYIIQTVEEEEARFLKENGRKPTELERQGIINKIGDYLIKQFKNRQVNPELLTFTEQEKKSLKEEQLKQDQALKYQNAGVDVPLSNLQTILSDKANIPKLPKMETSWFKLDSTDRKNYTKDVVIPTVQKFLVDSFGVQLTPSMWTALSDPDAQKVYTDVASAFGIDENLVKVIIGNILNGQQ